MNFRRVATSDMHKLLNFLGTIAVIMFFSCLLSVEVRAEDPAIVTIIHADDKVQYTLYDDNTAALTAYDSGVTNVEVPAQITYENKVYYVKAIAKRALGSSSLQSITISDGITTIEEGAFQYCSSLTSVSLPSTLTSIGGGAFYDCSMESIVLPEGLTSIGYGGFQCCEELKDVNFPSTLTSIGGAAFALTAIENLTIPATLTDIGSDAFSTCKNLKSVTLPDNMTTIPEKMFIGCTGLTDLNFLKNITTIGISAFNGCTGLTEFNLPAGVTTIGERAFSGCENIKTVVIPDGVTTIGTSAFSFCTALESVQMTNNVTSLGNRTFYGCSALTDIRLSNNIISIGDYMFYECSSLETIKLPDKISSIGELAFKECRKLSYIVVPEGVTSIGDQAFYNCSGLEYMILPSTLETTGAYWDTVYDQNGTTQLRVPAIFYPAGTETPSGDGYGRVNVKASYEEKVDGTVSVTIDWVYGYADEDIEITFPEAIGGKSVSTVEYGEGVSESDFTIACTKHYAPQLSYDGKQHFYEVCSICKETKVNAQAHSYGDGSKKCICGYVPFSLNSSAQSGKIVYGYTDTIALEAVATATLGTEVITYQWYENGKAVSGATDASYKLPTGKKVGEYTYYCKVSSGGYAMSSAKSMVKIAKKPITVRVDGAQRKQGEENPAFTYTVTEGALLEGDTTDDWKVALTTTATKDSPAGIYDITGSITSNNYEIIVTSGILTIATLEQNDSANQNEASNENDSVNQDETFVDDNSKAEYEITNSNGNETTVTYVKSNDAGTTTLLIPESVVIDGKTYKVTSIANNAFRGCTNLKTVVIGKNVKTIGKNAFYGCKKLKTVKMGSNVVTIGDKAFYKCTSLAAITIPSKVKKIGKSAFEACKSLKSITIKSKLLKKSKVGKKAFKGIKKKATIKVPTKKYKTYKNILKRCGVGSTARYKKIK